jgi:excisionase family DNA binding protein
MSDEPDSVYFGKNGNRCVSLAEAARLKGVSREIIRRLVADGRLPSERLGLRVVVVPVNALDTYTPNRVHVKAAKKASRRARRARRRATARR